MMNVLLVFLGGGLGSVTRYWVSQTLARQFESTIPLGTFTVNMVGCFWIGMILSVLEGYGRSPHASVVPSLSLLFVTGFCGGFTTFSSFAYENSLMIEHQSYATFIVYAFSSLGLGLLATFLGIWVVKGLS
jgi:CrcB protein